jgi:dTDP-D-glucose 4,6-dehydratase
MAIPIMYSLKLISELDELKRFLKKNDIASVIKFAAESYVDRNIE